MKIGIDARFFGTAGKGLGRYTSELIRHLEKIDQKNEYVIFLRKANFDEYVPASPRFRKELAEFPWYGWREQILYPLWLRKFRLDLMHFPHFNVPILYLRPFVVTIHDLILREYATVRATTLGAAEFRLKYLAYRAVIGRALRSAKRIITVSNFTKNEIEKKYPFTKKRGIEVTYEACATSFRSMTMPSTLPGAAFSPYCLYVGNAYPHKNLERLIEAFATARGNLKNISLILVGAKDYFYERLEAEARRKKISEKVIFFGQANDEQLAGLYAQAAFYIFPSLHEGFGLPPLEAMCQGVPVASSNYGSMPEILKDAAYYFDPTTAESIAKAIQTMATNETLRNTLVSKGLIRVTEFSWIDCAKATLAIYEKVL